MTQTARPHSLSLRFLAAAALLAASLSAGAGPSAGSSQGAYYRPDSTCTGDRAAHITEPPVKRAMAESDVIFIGNPFAVHDPVPLSVTLPEEEMVIDIGFEVMRAWKGDVRDTVWVRTMRSQKAGGWAFVGGFTYLVYARRYGDVIWTDACCRSRLAQNSETDFYYLGKPTFDDGTGRVPDVTIETLLQTVRNNMGTKRLLAMNAVSLIEEEAEAVLPLLAEVYRTGRGSERTEAISGIARMRGAAQSQIPLLLEAAVDSASFIRQAAAGAFGEIGIGSPEVVGALVRLCGDGETVVRGMAARSLGRLGVDTPEVTAALTSLLEDRAQFTRDAARGALDAIAARAKKPLK